MKKTLSLLLVLAMVLSSFGFAFAAEDKVVPAEFLNKKGILKGNAEGDLMLDKNLKRQDMIIMLSRLLGVEDEAKAFEGKTSFTDVADSFYVPYIAWAEAKELTNGKAEGKFGFDEPVTVQQVAQFMLRALGYGEVKWDEVPAKAVELGLVEKGADLTVDAKRSVLAEITYKALGTKMKDSDKTLAEHLSVELPVPAKLEVKEVRADNLKEIKVVFNKQVNRDNVEDRDIYTTNAGSVKDAQLVDDNTVILTLEGEMKNKKEYKLTIRGFKDATEVNKEYKFKAYDNTVPEVEEVVGLGTKAVKVVMSEPVKSARSSNFKVDGKSYYGSVNTTGREIILKPYGSDFSVGDHKLVVTSLEDYAGFKSVEKELEFTIAEDKEAPTVVEVKGTLERVVVTFSEDVDDATVSKDSLYWGGAKSNKAEKVVRLSGNRYAFEFTGTKTLPTYETTVTVKDVKDYSGNEMKAQDVAYKAEIDQTRPEVLDVDVDAAKIEVKFNKRLNKEDAEKKSNYTITDEDGKKVSIKTLELSDDARTVTIKLYTDLKENKDYTLEITGIRDNTKLANTILPYKEKITAGNYKRPKVSAITGNPAKETIHILFNKKMDVETIANPANYMLAHKDGNYALDAIKGDVDVIQDGRAVILQLPEKFADTKVKDMKFGEGKDVVGVILSGSIKDTAENRIQKYGEIVKFSSDEVKAEAEAKDKRTIEVEFSHPVTAAKASDFVAKGFDIERVKTDGTKVVVIETKKDLHPGLKDQTLAIDKDNKIETVLDLKIKEHLDIKLTDSIKPSIDKVKAEMVGDKLVLSVYFDEELKTEDKLGLVAKGDLKITNTKGATVKDIENNVTSKIYNKDGVGIVELTIKEFGKKEDNNLFIIDGIAYGVTITNPTYIRDNSNNTAAKTDEPEYSNDLKVPTADEKAAKAATEAVEKAEKSKLKADVEAAKVLVTALKDEKVKAELQGRLDKIEVAPETYEVTLAGNAVKDTDYTVTGAENLKAVVKGTKLTIKATNKITVDGETVEVSATKEITINEAKTITINKAE